MKSFTAKEFSRCPAKVYEAAREDGKAEVTHDRFSGSFIVIHDPLGMYTSAMKNCSFIGSAISEMYDANKKAPD